MQHNNKRPIFRPLLFPRHPLPLPPYCLQEYEDASLYYVEQIVSRSGWVMSSLIFDGFSTQIRRGAEQPLPDLSALRDAINDRLQRWADLE